MFVLLLSQVKSLKEIFFVTIRVCVSVSPVFFADFEDESLVLVYIYWRVL